MIDDEVSLMRLTSLGLQIDSLTEEQEKYLADWQE